MSNEFKKISSSVTARGVRIGLHAGSSCWVNFESRRYQIIKDVSSEHS